MGLATEQLSQQLLEYEKKVSMTAMMELKRQVHLGMTGVHMIIRLLSLNFSKNKQLYASVKKKKKLKKLMSINVIKFKFKFLSSHSV